MAKPERKKLERVQYWQGQTLRSRDFRNLQAVEAQRRWWHNRAIHNAYGVAEGFNATLNGYRVEVCPGIAYDAFGRELILERTQMIPLPQNVPSSYPAISLLIRYLPAKGEPSPDEICEVCWTQRGPLRPGTVTFIWKAKNCVTPIDGVVIFNLVYLGGGTTSSGEAVEVIPQEAQNFAPIGIEPLARPLLASGSTVPGNTPWEDWPAPPDGNNPGQLIGVQTWVDTTSGGFTDVPCYFAWLEGPILSAQPPLLLPALLPNVTDVSITGFTFRMWWPPPPPTLEFYAQRVLLENLNSNLVSWSQFDLFAQQQELYVSWIGCQMRGKACSCSQQSLTANQNSTVTAIT